jgi:hypothetical protein
MSPGLVFCNLINSKLVVFYDEKREFFLKSLAIMLQKKYEHFEKAGSLEYYEQCASLLDCAIVNMRYVEI